MYVDSIYPWLSHLRSRYVGDPDSGYPLTALEIELNDSMCGVRIAIEWDYKDDLQMFKI